MRTLLHAMGVFFGSGIGSALRYAVNIAGWAAMGGLAEWLAWRDTGVDPATKLFLTTGISGGFTTFSAFALAGFLTGIGVTRTLVAP